MMTRALRLVALKVLYNSYELALKKKSKAKAKSILVKPKSLSDTYLNSNLNYNNQDITKSDIHTAIQTEINLL
jgi:Tfp pilus assembly protein PilE